MRNFQPWEIRGVIFDLDNTLLQSRLGATQGLKVASSMIAHRLRKHGYNYSKSQILRKLHLIERERRAPDTGLVLRKLYNRDTWWESLLKQLHATKLHSTWIHKTTLRYWDAYRKASPPFPDAEATVRKLKKAGYRLAIVSDSDGTPGMKRLRLESLPFRNLFETTVVAGDDTPRVKPSKAPFLLAAERLGLSPQCCVYIGDNPETDVEGAKATGMTTILIKRRAYAVPLKGRDPPRASPTFQVRSLKEIPVILAD